MASNGDITDLPYRHPINDNICSVCGSRPACLNFGEMTCASCKMFFRRNETYDLAKNRCRFDRICDMSVSNRRACRYCRLQKCFAVGMKRELFRSAHGQNVSRRSEKTLAVSTVRKEPIYPRDLLQQDRSALTTEQWSLLSNVVNTYDGQCPIREIRQQMAIHATCPPRLRLKMISTNYINFVSFFYTTIVRFIENLTDFNGLTKRNRAIVLERNMTSLGGFHGLFIVRELGLDTDIDYTWCSNTTYGYTLTKRVTQIVPFLDQDGTLFKLLLVVLSFSTCYNYVLPEEKDNPIASESHSLTDSGDFLAVQNTYVEILFKYMLFRFGYIEASMRFAGLIQVVLEQNKCLQTVKEVEPHEAMIKEVVQDAERILCLDDSNAIPTN